MIVADASVLVVLVHHFGAVTARAWERAERDPDLHAPELVYLEVVNAFRRALQRGQLQRVEASDALVTLRDLPVERYPHAPFLSRVWELRDNLTAYDASYVALAEALGARLVTTDVRLAQAPGVRCDVELLA